MSEVRSQNRRLLAFLQAKRQITPLQALRSFGCFRLAARVHDLRKAGHEIETVRLPGKSHVAYRLVA